MKHLTRGIALLLAGLLLLALTACGGGGKAKADTITIYDGLYSEMHIVHQMVKLLVEEHTGAKVDIRDEMSPVNAYNEMLKGTADLTNSYDGTLLTTYLHLDAADVPAGVSLYDFVNEQGAAKGVRLLEKLGTNNTYTIGVSQELAAQHGLETISDLIPLAPQLIFGAEHDFFTQEGSGKYDPLVAFYGLRFKEARQVDMSLKYSAFESGNLDVMVVYATDGLNRRAGLKVLADDQGFFPEYNGALLVRNDLFDRLKDTAPNLEEVLNRLGGAITDAEMVDMTYAVDVDGRSAQEVAREFLQGKGLIG